MVAPTFTLLAALNPKPAAPGAAASDTISSHEAGRHFAKLVEKSSNEVRDTSGYRARPRIKIDSTERTVPVREKFSLKYIDREITPREAKEILKDFDAAATKLGFTDKDPKIIASLKEKLQSIADGNSSVSLKDILAAATGKDPKELMALLDTPHGEKDGTLVSQLHHMLNLMNKTLHAHPSEGDELADEPVLLGPPDTALPDVSVSDIIITSEEIQLASIGSEITTITPLSSDPVLVPVITPHALHPPVFPGNVSETVYAAPTEAVSAIDISAYRNPIDLIAPLALKAEEKKLTALPEVELPKTASTDREPDPVRQPPVLALPPAIERQLQALNDNRQFFVPGVVKDETAPVAAAKANAPTVNLNAIQPSFAIGAATGPNAVNPIGAVAGGLLNHAPIREQVHVAISKAAKEGIEQITIALDPAGLGRVEVKLHTGQDGKTSISFLVDNPETFDALSRDARGLERSLQESGLKADSGGMQFNLRQQAQQNAQDGEPRQANNRGPNAPGVIHASAEAPARNYRVNVHDGIDIHA